MRQLSWLLILALLSLPAWAEPVRMPEAIAQFEAMRTDDALKSFNKLQQSEPTNAEVMYYLGRIFIRKFQYDLAARWFRKAIDIDPSAARYRVALCEALGKAVDRASIFDQIGIAREVYSQLQKAAEIEPDNTLPHDALVQYYMEAPSLAGGSSRKARNEADEIARIDPGLGHRALGDIALYEKRYDDAEREYAMAIRMLPDDPLPSYQLLMTYQKQEKYDQMRSLLKTITESFPNESAIYYHQAEILILSGQISDQAVQLLQAYIKLGPRRDEDPNLYQAYLELGHVHQRMKHWFAARRAYQNAKDLNPDDDDIRAALKSLD